MKQLKLSLRAQFIFMVSLFSLICLALLSMSVYVSSRHTLLDFQIENADLNVLMKARQVQRILDNMVSMTFATSMADVFQVLIADSSPPELKKILLLQDALGASGITQFVYYNRSLDHQFSVARNQSEEHLGSNALYPLDSLNRANQKTMFSYLNATAVWIEGPVRVIRGDDWNFYITVTMPVIHSTLWNPISGLNDVLQNINKSSGYVTAVYNCAKLQSFLGDMSAAEANSYLLPSIFGQLLPSGAMQLLLPLGACNTCAHSAFMIPRYMWESLKEGSIPRASAHGGPFNTLIALVPISFYNKSFAVGLLQEYRGAYRLVHNMRIVTFVTGFMMAIILCFFTLILVTLGTGQIVKLKHATKSTGEPPRPTWHMFLIPCLRPKWPPPDFDDGSDFVDIRLPRKVAPRRHLRDELDDITIRFNTMGDELTKQYFYLQDRVQARKEEIEQARKAANEANAAKSHFLARVTHELRNPLNGILGTASLCLNEQSLPEIHKSLKTIYKCGELLLHLMTDLLTFSQSEKEAFELDEHEFMIGEVTSQLIAIFNEQCLVKGLELNISASPECHNLILFGDINRILQVVFNLISNSIKFTPRGGKIYFEANVSETDDSEKRIVTFVVRDTGPGIAPHLQAKIFEAFVQGDIQNTVRKAGVGLGLSICRQLADRMGGTVHLKSELGHGAEFTFELPLKCVQASSSADEHEWPEYECYSSQTIGRKAEAELGTHKSTTGSHHVLMRQVSAASLGFDRPFMRPTKSYDGSISSDLRVLVTDDNKVNQEVMKRMLMLEGLNDISIANDGQEALDEVDRANKEGKPFDVIFMDVQMPNMDGLTATRILRNEKKYTAPIVAVSAFATELNVENCTKAGMTLFLGKPLRRPHLHKVLEGLKDLNFDASGLVHLTQIGREAGAAVRKSSEGDILHARHSHTPSSSSDAQ